MRNGPPGAQRRLDWTLLLPLVDRAETVLVEEADEGERLVTMGVAGRWAHLSAPGPRGDLVVARAPRRHTVAELASRVAPGGLLYVEAAGVFGLASVERQCRSAGLAVRSSHWVTPSLTAARRYVPLDAPWALVWHLRTLYVADTPVRRAARDLVLAALDRAPRLCTRISALLCDQGAVVAERPPFTRPSRPQGAADLVLTSGHDAGSRSVMMEFRDGTTHPVDVVKVALTDDARRSSIRERRRVRFLHASLPADLAAGLPRPLGVRRMPQGLAFTESEAPGRTLLASAGEWGRSEHARRQDLVRAVDWLVRFGEWTASTSARPQPWTHDVDGHLAVWTGASPVARRLVETCAVRLRHGAAGHRSVHLHGDPGPWNVYLAADTVSLIDWELGPDVPVDAPGPPLADVLYLVTYWCFAVTRCRTADEEADVVAALLIGDRSAPWSRAAADAIDTAMHAAGFGHDELVPLAVALWSRQALIARARARRYGAEPTVCAPETYIERIAQVLDAQEVPTPCPLQNAR